MALMAKPLVGITTYVTPASFGPWELESALIPYDYVRGVERAGARVVLVPPSDDGVEEVLDVVDGLVFSGGSDLDPDLYGQERHPETNGIVPARDSAELTLLAAALERDMPVLAVCRGSQVLNVARGGDLEQHLPDHIGHERKASFMRTATIKACGRMRRWRRFSVRASGTAARDGRSSTSSPSRTAA